MIRHPSGLFPIALAALLATGCGGDTVVPIPAPFTSISAGILHTCGLVGDGVAYCWGYNEEGQLGDGSHSQRTSPVQVLGELRFTALAAGGQHTCGLTANGAAYCWGLNLTGQLGDGTNTSRATPGPSGGTATFGSIRAAATYSCALDGSGAAHCWGLNDRGQLGDGSDIDRASPVPVSGGLSFTTIKVSTFHSCALTAAGEAYCWGENEDGQLGNGAVTPSPTPVQVASSETFMAVDVGFYHTCALTVDGRALCWGANNMGQLGLGENASGGSQLTPAEIIGTLRFASIDVGAVFSCGVEQGTGAAYCWGFNGSGQLGYLSADTCVEDNFPSPCNLVPDAVSGGLSFASISANTQHICGLTTDGVAYCWGLGENGQRGDGTKGSANVRVEPVRVLGQP